MKPYLLVIFVAITITARANHGNFADSTRSPPAPTVKAHAHYDGILSLATDGQYTFFCLGGPSVGISQGNWRIAINMYPSLRIGRPEGSPSPVITPTLGTGIYVAYKRVLLLVPLHYISEERKWTVAVGLGWRVTK
jgi:hypothetical protein